MKLEDRPLWYDVYRAFPPESEPHFAKDPVKKPVPNIFYSEDKFRADFHKKLRQSLPPIDLKGIPDKNPTKLAVEMSLDGVDDIINTLRNKSILPPPYNPQQAESRGYQNISGVKNIRKESNIADEFKKQMTEDEIKSINTENTKS
ncbi:uncharacterized protein LOC126841811 isoform X2 [Adelges cooleyi]|nr:uncharacterized protein LOC126841811 isoform X2 [Adelges cooleyi]